jgi:hypothetical protein
MVTGYHDNVYQAAGDCLLEDQRRQHRTVTEGDVPQQGRLGFRYGPIDSLDHGHPDERAALRKASPAWDATRKAGPLA